MFNGKYILMHLFFSGACTSDDMKVPMPKAPLKADVEREAEEKRAKSSAQKPTESADEEKEEL